jgi:ribosomal protein S18 acetylase RimI-like enzyme
MPKTSDLAWKSPSTVERAQPVDAPAAEALLDAAAAWLQSAGIEQWKPGQFSDEVRQTIASGDLFVARRGGALVGCFLLEIEEPASVSRWLLDQRRSAAPGAFLSRLAVAREAAGHGLGADLLNAACAIAAQHGRAYLRLVCVASNGRLKRYYREAGFADCGDIHSRGPNGEHWVTSLFERPTRIDDS